MEQSLLFQHFATRLEHVWRSLHCPLVLFFFNFEFHVWVVFRVSCSGVVFDFLYSVSLTMIWDQVVVEVKVHGAVF